ncbi:hypothetical protein, partial [Erwinia mallotivora]|uniref:hypothetical protein n=1 Tax=Erwinia mallotivora TaxID=69222 RepID=UPI0021C25479
MCQIQKRFFDANARFVPEKLGIFSDSRGRVIRRDISTRNGKERGWQARTGLCRAFEVRGPAAGQASDRSIPVTCPLLDLNDPPQIADFIA